MTKRMDQLLEKQKKLLEQKQRAEAEEKAVQKQIKELERSERTHRLCTRGGYLEKLLGEPELLSEEDAVRILDYAFSTPFVKEALAKLLETKRKAAAEVDETETEESAD